MRKRLDQLMVEKHLAPTRSRARDVIQRGLVSVSGVIVTKPGARFDDDAPIATAAGTGLDLVSRAGLKLSFALEAFDFEARDRLAADIGASTGGFTEVLLQNGAQHVFSVDVGSDQLHLRLRTEPRVTVLENLDARRLTKSHLPNAVNAVVIDVSFISVLKVLPNILSLTAPDAWLVALIKPQFEVGPSAIGKGGVVRDVQAREDAVNKVKCWLQHQPDWTVIGICSSPIVGGSGNSEYLIGAQRNG